MNRRVAQALAGSAAASAAVVERADDLRTAAGLAWRWVVHPDALDLYAVGRPTYATWIGGGGALHRARIALAADGLSSRTTLLPDSDPIHLATLEPVARIAITDEARQRFDATEGPLHPVRRERLTRDLVQAATAEGVGISVRQEGAELIAVLYGADTPVGWLRAGEALSAVRLEAARHGLTAVPTLAGRERPPPSADALTGANSPETANSHRSTGSWGQERRRDTESVVYVHLRVT